MVIQWLYSSKNEGLPNETDGRLQATKERVFSSFKYLNWHLLLREFLKAKKYEHLRKNILKEKKKAGEFNEERLAHMDYNKHLLGA